MLINNFKLLVTFNAFPLKYFINTITFQITITLNYNCITNYIYNIYRGVVRNFFKEVFLFRCIFIALKYSTRPTLLNNRCEADETYHD